ncbi:MAG TPA: asparagine synthase (glutamine-hydrolyzing) [Chloroflexota bacterium]
MCGICGVVNLGPRADATSVARLTAMADTLRHRGPDSDGYYVSEDRNVGLAFRRLSIVDLATGDQPMANEDESLWLVFNGEIYNHADHRPGLEARGHRFRSRCDAEVILHLYEEYGPDCIHQLRGMFAFALWDARRRQVLLARDRIGVKPLYFATTPDALLFGSEIKALFAHPGLEPTLNEAALSLYLTFASTPAPQTLFANVQKLPPGHRLIVNVDTGAHTMERYWEPLPDAAERRVRRLPEEYVERLEALVRESIGLRMMSDVPYGAFLSGGVDSSLNVALMAELADRPVHTFSVAIEGDPSSDERHFARAVAERYGTRHHEVVIDEQAFVDYLPELVWHQDEPLADPVCVPLHAISQAAHDEGIKVIQVGEGSDELFSGYTSYAFFTDFYRRIWRPYLRLPSPLRRAAAASLAPMMSLDKADVLQRGADHGELFWGGAIPFFDAHKDRLLVDGGDRDGDAAVAALYAEVDRGVPRPSQLDRMIGIELRQRLPELLLMRVDKVTMGSSLEARVPYLDHRLVEFALAIPSEVKYRAGVTKWVLKRVAERVGLERELVYRRKRGFCGSATNMLSPRLLARAEQDILDSAFARERFNLSFVRQMLAEQRAGRADHNFRLWSLWNLVAWHACWFEGARARPAEPSLV